MPGNDEDIEVEETVQTPNISHSERLRAFGTTFQFFEERGASVMDLLFLRRVLMKQQNADCSTKYNRILCIPLKKKVVNFCKVDYLAFIIDNFMPSYSIFLGCIGSDNTGKLIVEDNYGMANDSA
ncbi:hypothetical protein TNCV_786401 [Trichonephila clavipes]|nr:hypothetical protein TNCV_786401 [Trichonephila clavipes]